MLIVSPLKAFTVVCHEKPVVFSHDKATFANPKAFSFSSYINPLFCFTVKLALFLSQWVNNRG